MTVVIEMAKRAIHRIIVLDDESKLARIVTPMDVVCTLADDKRFDVDA